MYARERTPIQNEVYSTTIEAWNRAVRDREAPAEVILTELNQRLQAQLDEAWARLDAQGTD